MHNNYIITGIPRSGTTLVTALIDSLPNAVALNEPNWQSASRLNNRAYSTGEDFSKWLVGDFLDIRHKLINKIPLIERRSQTGEVLTNYYKRSNGEVINLFKEIPFTRSGLNKNLILGVKQIGPYLGILPHLSKNEFFKIIAIVRNPLNVLISWRSLRIPPSIGKLPGAQHWNEMQTLAASDLPLLDKQVKIYDLMCKRLYNLRNFIITIKYEELINNPVLLLNRLNLNHLITSNYDLVRKDSCYINYEEKESIIKAIYKHDNYIHKFYSIEEIDGGNN